VYAVGHAQIAAVARAAAAVLACGPGAVLSHSPAAALWRVRERWEFPLEATVAVDRRRAGIRTHRCTTLARRDVRRQLGIRVTSPARTLLEIAPRLTTTALARAVNDARLTRHLRLAQLDELLSRMPRHPGTRALRAVLEVRQAPTRSAFEDAFPGVREALWAPHAAGEHARRGLGGRRAVRAGATDRRARRLRVPPGQGSFEDGRERDPATLAAGHATVRVTWERLHDESHREAARLHQILRARRNGAGDA